MKIDKKTIIIIVVVAVAAYLLWKKKNGQEISVSDVNLTSEPDHTTLDYILTHISFTSAERNKIESMRQAVEKSNTWRQSLLAKANETGRSFDQQLVLSAIWLLYHPGEEWIAGPNGKTNYGWNLQQKVLSL